MRLFESWCMALAACYFAVVLLCIVQTTRIAYYGHRVRSFRVGFLVLSIGWMALKGVFWLSVQSWSLIGLVVFSELPPCGQMASYLLFLVFCAQHVHRQIWAVQGPRYWLAFTAANLATLGSVVGFSIPALLARDSDSSAASATERKETRLGMIFSVSIYAVLCASLATYAWLIWNQRDGAGSMHGGRCTGARDEPDTRSLQAHISFKTGFVKKSKKASGIVPVLFVASGVFLLRAVYDLVLVTDLVTPITIKEDNMGYVVPFYLLTEIFPTLLLLLYFRAIPTKPPRPRHIPSARPTAETGLLARGAGHAAHLGIDSSSLTAEVRGSMGAQGPSIPVARSLGTVNVEKGRERDQQGKPPLAVSGTGRPAARSFAAFDPFKSDSEKLPPAFGARRTGANGTGNGGRAVSSTASPAGPQSQQPSRTSRV